MSDKNHGQGPRPHGSSQGQDKPRKKDIVDDLFREVEEELDEDTKREAKIQIKRLLVEKQKAERLVANYQRQIDDLRLKISNDLHA